jgi:hypothetical protein
MPSKMMIMWVMVVMGEVVGIVWCHIMLIWIDIAIGAAIVLRGLFCYGVSLLILIQHGSCLKSLLIFRQFC